MVTCGEDYPTACGAWERKVASDIRCPTGVCDHTTCCEKDPDVIYHAECDPANIANITTLSGGDKFTVADAKAACNEYSRKDCYAVLDVGCDGQQLQRCIAKKENDPKNLVVKMTMTTTAENISAKSAMDCIAYKPAQKTCGYDYTGTCAAGEKIDFDVACDDVAGGYKMYGFSTAEYKVTPASAAACTQDICCTPKECSTGFSQCMPSQSLKPKAGAMCLSEGCNIDTCCLPITCGTDFTGHCSAGEDPVNPSTVCENGQCTQQQCCKKKVCADSYTGCVEGWKPKNATVYCLQPGCDRPTCCQQLTCSVDFTAECDPGEEPVDEGSFCSSTGCDKKTCCQRRVCRESFDGCVDEWKPKIEKTLCLAAGCDVPTCCSPVTCGADYIDGCDAGQDAADSATVCPGGNCTKSICCVPKVCSKSYENCGVGWKPKNATALCKAEGCDQETCCSRIACGTDYATPCGAWDTANPEALCSTGTCSRDICCTRDPKIIPNAECETESIPLPSYISAANAVKEAAKFCDSQPRTGCYAIQDEDCNGKGMRYCKAKNENDPLSVVVKASARGCIWYQKARKTCGYHFDQQCAAGEKVPFYEVCPDSGCTQDICCVPKVCSESFHDCGIGWKPKENLTHCEKNGCNQKTCCLQLTCGADFPAGCNPWDKAKDASTLCPSGDCTETDCCIKNPDIRPHHVCKGESIFGMTPVQASDDVAAAVKECQMKGRKNCFGIQDANCDGKELSICAPLKENDIDSVVIKAVDTSDCVWYVKAKPTCQYFFPKGCSKGENMNDEVVCPDTGCTKDVCCSPKVCQISFNGCLASGGLKPKDAVSSLVKRKLSTQTKTLTSHMAKRKLSANATCGGNSGGRPCHFPFIYKGVPNYACTTVEGANDQPWCYVDAAGSSWGNCNCTNAPPITLEADTNLDLVAYWDYGSCGPAGDDHNWDWCHQHSFQCEKEVATDKCDSGIAVLVRTHGTGYNSNYNGVTIPWGTVSINGCDYAYFAEYTCVKPKTAGGDGQTLCLEAGCDTETCCAPLTCGADFGAIMSTEISPCQPGQDLKDSSTECGGPCTENICCEPKECAASFVLGEGIAYGTAADGAAQVGTACTNGWKPKAAGTVCLAEGCDKIICCDELTCGVDFAGSCALGEGPVDATTKCVGGAALTRRLAGGECTQEVCCKPKKCAEAFTGCVQGWVPKASSEDGWNFCQQEGCDKETCCHKLTCGTDYHCGCDPGEKLGNLDELCVSGECTHDFCCVRKTCSEGHKDCGVGWKRQPKDTLCLQEGCDQQTCCSQVTCGADFPAGCGAWDAAKAPETVCITGVCNEATCCVKNPDVLPVTECNVENGVEITPLKAGTTVAAAMKQCNDVTRDKCFGIADTNCDGKAMSICVPRNTNDIKTVVVKAAVNGASCVYFKKAEETCGYFYNPTLGTTSSELQRRLARLGGSSAFRRLASTDATELPMSANDTRCSPGKSLAFDAICPNGICAEELCCVPKKCNEYFFDCYGGFKPKPNGALCAASGCDEESCCDQMICGADFPVGCGAWDFAKDPATKCKNAPCDRSICCDKDPNMMPNTTCNVGSIETIYDMEFDAQAGVMGAKSSCSSFGRKDCFGIVDMNCDGGKSSPLRRCVPKKENDPQSVVLQASAGPPCVIYRRALKTCGYDFPGPCAAGEKNSIDTVCDGRTEAYSLVEKGTTVVSNGTGSCTAKTCCVQKTCLEGFENCVGSYKPRPAGIMCLSEGCDRETCCDRVTCGADYSGTCSPGEEPSDPDTICIGEGPADGICTQKMCCKKKECAVSFHDCVDGWKPAPAKTFCLAEGCDQATCCVRQTCADDYKAGCGPGENEVVNETFCGTSGCTQDVCCEPKVCEDSFMGCIDNYKRKPKGTLCNGEKGCDRETCCEQMTCGADYHMGCSDGENAASCDTHCDAGNCTQAICCVRKVCSASYVCPLGYQQKGSKIECEQEACSLATCCEKVTCGNSFALDGCNAWDFRASDDTHCVTGKCDKGLCCDPNPKIIPDTECYGAQVKQIALAEASEKDNVTAAARFCDLADRSACFAIQDESCDGKTLKYCIPLKTNDPESVVLKSSKAQTCVYYKPAKKTCGYHFGEDCQPGEDKAVDTVCDESGCTSALCCQQKVCQESYPDCGNGWKHKPAELSTLCNPGGCTQKTCCVQLTCGKDFAGTCGAWDKPKGADTKCTSGICCEETCCEPNIPVIPDTNCNVAQIDSIKKFDDASAENDVEKARAACDKENRAHCFAVVDEMCDGKELRRCVPKHENDISSVVLMARNKSCVYYREAKKTCGYHFTGVCAAGEDFHYYHVCDSGTCTKSQCCTAKVCADSHMCSTGWKPLEQADSQALQRRLARAVHPKVKRRRLASNSTCGGNAGGKACHFPFTYKGKAYQECTMADNNQPWCATTDDGASIWGNCNCPQLAETDRPDGDTLLTSYYDYGKCGPHGDDHHWSWCKTGSYPQNEIPLECAKTVETEDCASGTAKLVKVLGTGLHNTDPPPATWGNIQIDGCQYGWYAQYECVVPEIAITINQYRVDQKVATIRHAANT
jgi:prolyl-tRNA editing enzyme YbaK/EbsC (Cys-tRNA(Pro) deacylase)